ncbi:hypothetical protein GOD80_23390 [Sinorhizobium medicae]|nr:hypothetical protein [Sinorhizobium medicae]
MPNTDERQRATEGPDPTQKKVPDRQIDPSESVTLFAIALGAIGALVGLVAGIAFLSDAALGAVVLNCLIAVLAGGSAGVVAGGTLGAAIGVMRGVRVPKQVDG